LLAEAEVRREDIAAVALSLGPGSFTGVRIGAAEAKTLAQFQGIPLLGISTLEALAYPYRDMEDVLLVPMVNARRQQAYVALYRAVRGELQRITPDMLLAAEPFAELLQSQQPGFTRTLLLGQLTGLPTGFTTNLPGASSVVRSLVTPHALAALAAARLERGEQDDPMTLAPIYLRGAAE
jgi:tRNA threonylcarbamoyladenosine biosynthesis protein TsaB